VPRFRPVFAALTGAAAMLASAMVCSPASASAAAISIYSAGPTDGNPGVLTVVATDGNNLQLTSMTVHIYSGSTDEYDVTDMAYTSGPGVSQTWTATAPIPQADLAPGTYTMTVDASDANETDTGITTPEPLAFVYRTTITATPAPSSVSYNKTSVSISGQLTGIAPGSGSSAPVGLGGVPVYLRDLDSSDTTQIGTTQPDGSYTAQAQLASTDDQYIVMVQDSSTVGNSGVPLAVTWIADPTRVSASVSPEDFTYGSSATATLTGTAEYESGKTWLPLQDYSIYVNAGATVDYVTTDAQGHFSWPFSPSDGTEWNVLAGGGDQLQQSQADGSIHVAMPLTFTSFSASLSPAARLTVHGCVKATVSGSFAPQGHMTIQYAASPKGPWKYLGRVSLTEAGSSSCDGDNHSYVSGSVPVRTTRAYYRARYPANPDYQAVASRAVLRWKYATRIVSTKITPGRVSKGGKITVSGRVQQYNRRWRDYGKRRILIILKPKGSKTWYWIRKVTASASGHFSATLKDPVSATWSAEFAGNTTHFAAAGKTRYVPVAGSKVSSAAIVMHRIPLHDLNPG
jgi:hypothetical protein